MSKYSNNRKINVATVFSGIGAFEFALKRLNIDHEIEFACDVGERLIDITESENEELKEKVFRDLKGQPDLQKKLIDDLYEKKTTKKNYVEQTYKLNYQNELKNDLFFQDIRYLDGTSFKDKVDLFVGGSPCQSFSTVGFQGGLEDARGTLFYEYARLVKEIRPKVFIYENVRGLTTHKSEGLDPDGNKIEIKTWDKIREILQGLDYVIPNIEDGDEPPIFNARNYDIPQIRQRVFVVGIRNDIAKKLKKEFIYPEGHEKCKFRMQDFLLSNVRYGDFNYDLMDGSLSLNNIQKADNSLTEKKVDITHVDDFKFTEKYGYNPKYILTPKLERYVMKEGTKTFVSKIGIDKEIARTVLSSMGNRHRSGVDNYISTDTPEKNDMEIARYAESRGVEPAKYNYSKYIRMLSEREALRLMGFTDDFKLKGTLYNKTVETSRAQAYKQAGNSIVVDVLMAIIEQIFETGVFE